MSTSLMIHNVTSVTSEPTPYYKNANSVRLTVCTDGGDAYELTFFGLPRAAAEYFARVNAPGTNYKDEAAIRADERAKVTERLAALIGGAS